jgi:hypothetical protein
MLTVASTSEALGNGVSTVVGTSITTGLSFLTNTTLLSAVIIAGLAFAIWRMVKHFVFRGR